jgi:hypothetical protein
MKRLYLTMAVLLAATALAPAQPGENPGDTDRAAERDSARREEKSASDSPDIREQVPPDGSTWPRTFVPTEKINADSAVSFPTDI